MARTVHLLLVAVLCCASQYAAATDQILECYTCIGYDKSQDENPLTNNKDCAEGSFNAKTIQTRTNKAPEGNIQLQCVVITRTDGDFNNGGPTTFRGPHNSTHSEPFEIMDDLKESLGANLGKQLSNNVRDSPSDNGELHIMWCSTTLCNGAASSAHLALATLFAALVICGLAV